MNTESSQNNNSGVTNNRIKSFPISYGMRLLIFTQKVDRDDTTLGFFHGWLRSFSEKFETITVICQEKGVLDLPGNVKVYSLGKEADPSKPKQAINLFKILKEISGSYDKVFVHMNEEYVLVLGTYFRFKKIPVYLWRNHPDGSLLTRLAVALSTKVFCTSKDSFTARFSKTVIMPAGIDLDLFKPSNTQKKKYSICMVGRVSPIKHVELALEASRELLSLGAQFSLSIIGEAKPKDSEYLLGLHKFVEENSLSKIVTFSPAVLPYQLSEVYSNFEICLNLTDSGSFDKTIVEATACGAIPLVANSSLKGILPDVCITKSEPTEIAQSIQRLFVAHEQLKIEETLKVFAKSQSLEQLRDKLVTELNVI